jgi:acetyltransferase-like isoleucine patch superfamily enzyme
MNVHRFTGMSEVTMAGYTESESVVKRAARRMTYVRMDWRRGLVRAYFRLCIAIGYFFDSTRALNRMFLTMPSELIPDTLAKFGAIVGKNTVIMPPLHVHNPGKLREHHFSNLEIGDRCYVGPESFIDLTNRITIRNEVTISMCVSLITHIDVGESPLRLKHFPPKNQPIEICNGAYIGASVTILKDVKIGECAVVGAGCVVVKEVPAGSVLIGTTSRVIRSLAPGEQDPNSLHST